MKNPLKHLGDTDRKVRRAGVKLGKTALDQLMPLHLWAGPTGHVLRAGPSLLKLRPEQAILGQRLTEILEFRRPRTIQSIADLAAASGEPVQVVFRAAPRTPLKGLVVALPAGQGVLLNLSLGISVADAVRSFNLTRKDFAPSDPTVEMLYLMEAQAAVLNESKKLNNRLQGAKIAAEEKAYTDTLTGLKNRRALDYLLPRLTENPGDRAFGLMHLDLDFFKEVNDTFGHAAGDFVLQQAARILLGETRSEDIVARVGGDEFVLVITDCTDLGVLSTIADRIIARLEKPIPFEGAKCRVSASIGITGSQYYGAPDRKQMASDADAALYASKRRGRARYTLYDPLAPQGLLQ